MVFLRAQRIKSILQELLVLGSEAILVDLLENELKILLVVSKCTLRPVNVAEAKLFVGAEELVQLLEILVDLELSVCQTIQIWSQLNRQFIEWPTNVFVFELLHSDLLCPLPFIDRRLDRNVLPYLSQGFFNDLDFDELAPELKILSADEDRYL